MPFTSLPGRTAALLLLSLTALLSACGGSEGGPGAPPPKPQLGSLSGQVTDSSGSPLAGVAVTAVGAEHSFSAATDMTGRFQFTSLTPGAYVATFSRAGFKDTAEAAQVRADWDTLLMVSMTSAAPRIGSISGQVSDPFGSRLEGVTVTASSTGLNTTLTDGQGKFQLSALPTGTYSLGFSIDGFEKLFKSVEVKAGQNTDVPVQLVPESLPSAASQAVRFVSTSGARLDFEVDVVVIAANGTPVEGLAGSAFTIPDSSTAHVALQSITGGTGNSQGPYSAVLLMDESGSIVGTDPMDSRIQAGKIFFSALSAPDNAQLAAFASSGSLPYPLTLWGSFTSSGSAFFSALDQLAGLENGGTPLYSSTATMVDHVSTQGSNANRAVVIFTDGEDTDGGWSLEQLIALAQSKHVKLFTVGLSNGVNFQVLSQMAAQTGGAMMWAADARQLISLYGSLGNLLRGTARFYRTRWSVTLSSGAWGPGGWVSGYVYIQTPAGRVSAPFYLSIPGGGLLPQSALTRPEAPSCPTSPATNHQLVICLPQ